MKIWKIILAVLTIIVGILLFAESEDVSRMGQLANALGANVSALTLYAGYIVSILYIVISILLFVYINKKDKQGDIIIIILSLVAFVFSFAGPKRFEDLPFLSFCAVLCLITAIISYIINKRNKNRLAEINKQCSHCGARIEDDSRFCSECGKEITKANVCPHCGASVGEGDAFCPNCGKNLSEPIAADNVEQTVEYGEEEESPTKKYLPYILVAIALIAICGGGWWYFNSSKAPQSNNEAAVAEAVEADTIVTEADVDDVAANTIQDNGVERPSVQKLGNLFNEMETGKLTALKDYGFTLKDKQKKMILSDYAEEGDEADIELIKEVYSLKYKMGNPSEMSDGFMKIIYVYAKEYGEPSMEIECDEKTWNELKFEAESSLKNSMGNSYILNMNSYINFIHEGAITVSTENSITWE